MELSDAELDELRSTVRSFLESKSPEDAVRKVMESESRYDPQVWAQMADQLRLPGLAIPEAYGGDGFGQAALGVVLEEMGRALACSPFFATVVLGAQALLASGDTDACARHLPGIAAGTTTAALAVAERTGAWDPEEITTRAVRRGEDGSGEWELTGTKSFVIDGASADLLLVMARTTAGPSLFTVDRGAPDLTAEPMETLDATRAMARLRLDGTPATLVGTEGAGGPLLARVLDLTAVGLAAEQAGGAARCLESSTEYAGTRVQFGRPIGSFQAVKHKCADILVQVELAQAAARESARLADLGDDGFPVAAAAAHMTCSRAYMFAASENIQVHGGIGFTWEHFAHLYFRRAKSSQLLLGGPSASRERLLERLGI
ncbi:acyl-CoA/acyl-ACP dehydrogenase [Streptomyces sp. CME 23]|nr:acyl-CoA dehydrogenase family protein [Streptomyces sp. CME 23]MCH5675570.1 acyl-CoA/acyl-ACP dehydrogenase [Streptomyces sp. CME 23]